MLQRKRKESNIYTFEDDLSAIITLPDAFTEKTIAYTDHLDFRYSDLTIPGILKFIWVLRSCEKTNHLRVLHIPCRPDEHGSDDDMYCILDAFDEAFKSRKAVKLQSLGLHLCEFQASDLPALASLFDTLHESLNGLALAPAPCTGTFDRHLLFRAIGRLKNLRVLAIPDWERLVSKSPLSARHLDCSAQGLDILVDTNTLVCTASAAPAGLKFFAEDFECGKHRFSDAAWYRIFQMQ